MTAAQPNCQRATDSHLAPRDELDRVSSGLHSDDIRPLLDDAIRQVDRPCRTAIDGRRAARALTEWVKQFGLSEVEFQLLWRLRSAASNGLDQTALSHTLAFSPAQISATVERLRARGWICASSAGGDRRRHHWQLAASGRELLEQMIGALENLKFEPATRVPITSQVPNSSRIDALAEPVAPKTQAREAA